MSANPKYNTGQKNIFDKSTPFKNMQFGIVQEVGKISINTNNEEQIKENSRFNADPHIIRCRIIGDKHDNSIYNSQLPNCFPLLPKHINVIPKKGERVLVFMFGENEQYSDRFYIGPIISQPSKLNKDTDENAQRGFSTSIIDTVQDISKIESAKGIYSEYDSTPSNSIDGRENSDIVFKAGEVLIRGGKFVQQKPLEFNQANPAYIQIKSNFNEFDEDGKKTGAKLSVNNIVADKINLLTHNGGNPRFNLVARNLEQGETPYITDEEMASILSEAHPLAYGDIVLQYLILLKNVVLGHVHNGSGYPATDRTDGNTMPVDEFVKSASILEKLMLSNNIRIN